MKKTDFLPYIDLAIYQDDKYFKVNTDTVCLGLFLDNLYKKSVLDIGTNNGALLLYALKNNAGKLIGVDINAEALKIAEINLKQYSDNFVLYHSRAQDLEIEKVKVIICNPPFFEMNNITDDLNMKNALFEESLMLEDLFKSFRSLLDDNGEIYLIYQADRFNELFLMCLKHKLKIMKMQFVYDVNKENASRILLKLKIGKMSKLHVIKPLFVNDGKIQKS
jgi:Predicted O-methyltransferase